jgi:hypothetical protein
MLLSNISWLRTILSFWSVPKILLCIQYFWKFSISFL